MASILADYPGGGYRTRVSGTSGIGLGGRGGYGLPDLTRMMGLAEERARQKLKMGDLEYELAQRAKRERYGPKLADWSHGDPNRVGRRQAESESLRAAAAQAKAISGGPPMTFVRSPGAPMGGGWQPDQMAMSGAQRAIFAPQQSQEVGLMPSRSATSGAQRGQAEGQQAADEWGIMRTMGLQDFLGMRPAPQGYGPQMMPEWRMRQLMEEAERTAVARGDRRFLGGRII